MSVLVGLEIFEVFKKDPALKGPDDLQLVLMEPYIKAMPSIFAERLNIPVTICEIIYCKLLFLRYCRDNNFLVRAETIMTEGHFGGLSKAEGLKRLADSMNRLISQLEALMANINQELQAKGLSIRQALLDPRVDMCAAAQLLYLEDELTVGKLLMVQPGLIIINTK